MPARSKRLEADVCTPTLSPAELIAAVSFAVDTVPGSCHMHGWRVAIVCDRLAACLMPEARSDLFYAALLHDIGSAGAESQGIPYSALQGMSADPYMAGHASRGAALVERLLNMENVAALIRSHHDSFLPGSLNGSGATAAGALLAAAVTAEFSGVLRAGPLDWSGMSGPYAIAESDTLAALRDLVEDPSLRTMLADPFSLAAAVAGSIAELGPPECLDGEPGVIRVLHLAAALVDMKDRLMAGHSVRAARYARTLATHMDMPDAERMAAYQAGLLHDLGRLGVPTRTLNKDGRLTQEELAVVRLHAEMTIRILGCLPQSPGMTEFGRMAGHHHERWDGGGYPDGLRGEDIPLVARILAVVDAYDAMTTEKSYRIIQPRGVIVRLSQGAGTQFDPDIVEAMISAVHAGEFDSTDKRAA